MNRNKARHTPEAQLMVPACASGFTLIEMMATLVVMGIFAQLVGSLTGWQIKQYIKMSERIALDDTARGVFTILRYDAHQAGYGFVNTPDLSGGVFVGDCLPDANLLGTTFSDSACTNRDENNQSDRLRFMYGQPAWSAYCNSATTGTNGPCTGGTEVADFNEVLFSQNDVVSQPGSTQPFGACYIFAGQCETGSSVPAASRVKCVNNDGGNPVQANVKGCAWSLRTYDEIRNNIRSNCSTGWKPGYSFSVLTGGTFVTQKNPTTGNWDLRRTQTGGTARIAKNISQFQVTYGIDLSDPMDYKLDDCPTCVDNPIGQLVSTPLSWCRDINSLCGMTLSNGSPVTADTIYSRIIAVYVSFVLYTKTPSDGVRYGSLFHIRNRSSL